jgi:CDP-paratose 2-epimerase
MTTTLPYAAYWFSFEDYSAVRTAVQVMRDLRIPEIRTALSWADWERPGGADWFDYFTGELEKEKIRILPCLFYTPPQKARTLPGEEGKTSYPPQRLEDYADFTKIMIQRYGHMFDWIQFWNESNWDVYWNWSKDPNWKLFAKMIGYAIPIAKESNKKIVLGGMSPYETEWVDRMFEYGIMQEADALGIHDFSGTWDPEGPRRKGRPWKGLNAEIEDARTQLRENGSAAEVWLTETGYSTYGAGEFKKDREEKQVRYFDELLSCPAERVYWHTLVDQQSDTPTDNELNSALDHDVKAYHFGVIDHEGRKKPLYHHWKNIAHQR